MDNGRRRSVPHDRHITVFMGTGLDWETLQGHIYVVCDTNGVPVRVMHRTERQTPIDGPPIEMYPYPCGLV